MERLESITIGDLRDGDVYAVGPHRYDVMGVRHLTTTTQFTLFYKGPGGRAIPYNQSSRMPCQRVAAPRTCAPCYDSDCNCVYDGVE